jgi:hypothetical protein
MKNQLSFVCSGILLLLCSCRETSQQETEVKASPDTLLVQAASSGQPALTTGHIIETWLARQKAVKEKLPSLTPAQANQLYVSYKKENDSILAELATLEQPLLDSYVSYHDATGKIILPDSVRPTHNLLSRAGIEFWKIGEGFTELRTVPGFYQNLFDKYLTSDYREYVAIIAREDEKLFTADAGLVISFEELGQWIVVWENYLKKYPQSQLSDEIKLKYKTYQLMYLLGLDNTPTMEYSTGKLYPENIAEFKRFSEKNPDSYTIQLIKIVLSNEDTYENLRNRIDQEQQKEIGL